MRDRRASASPAILLILLLGGSSALAQTGDQTARPRTVSRATGESELTSPLHVDAPDAEFTEEPAKPETSSPMLPEGLFRNVGTFVVVGAASLIPAGVLMLTAFVRISVVLLLVRQALGSPQVPGPQVITALALMLTLLVMWPVGERVYRESLEPLTQGKSTPQQAWESASTPMIGFMGAQIAKSGHEEYVRLLYDRAASSTGNRPRPETIEECPIHVVAPAFLISELTTAFTMGFAIFLPFLVVDLVVASVLSAMGLFLLPPTLVTLPIKLGLFVLADGWILIADMLVRSFAA